MSKYVSAPVAASRYIPGRTDTALTHIIEVDGDSNIVRVLCKDVKLASVLDDSSLFDAAPATCPRCLKARAKLACEAL